VTGVNALDLRGPQFLLFYAIVSLVVLAAVRIARRRPDVAGLPSRIDDPYALGALRGGPDEAIRLAVLSLLDRRLLKARDGRIQAIAPEGLARRAIEKALLRLFATERAGADAFDDPEVRAGAEVVDQDLARAGLIADEAALAARGRARVIGAVLLAAVAAAKIVVALSRGRTNVAFLVVEAGLAILLVVRLGGPERRTAKGDKALELARRAFARLEGSAATLRPGGATDELALAAAVFGLSVLPPLGADLLTEARLFPVRPNASWSSSSSCSSCGGSSCGGGCGGGGCGGCGS
jgi:uncharacterized protein (TIGR04222 family)